MAMNSTAKAYPKPQQQPAQPQIRLLPGRDLQQRDRARALLLRRVITVGIGLSIFIGMLTFAIFEAKISVAGRQIVSLQKQTASINTNSALLKIEIGELSSPGRIVAYAEQNLGMKNANLRRAYILEQEATLRIADGRAALNQKEQEILEPPAEAVVAKKENRFISMLAALFGNHFTVEASDE